VSVPIIKKGKFIMKNIIQKDSMKTRKSIRTFTGEKISATDKGKIINYINNDENLVGINGNKIKIQLMETGENISGKIGTYGIIKNAPAFLIITCKNSRDIMLDCGYVFERLLLYLEQNGLSTCWLGGTFNRKKLSKNIKLSPDEIIPIISPVGYANKKRSLSDKMIRSLAKGDSRINFDELFFDESFNHNIKDSNTREALEMVRLAPSASNKQPWRVLIDAKGDAHFFIRRTPNYSGEKLGYDIQWLDIGISIAHYEIAFGCREFIVKTPKIDHVPDFLEYVITAKK
jgi:hypothetical protein